MSWAKRRCSPLSALVATWEGIVTDVIGRSLSVDALSVSENKGQSFPTLAVGNAEMDSAGWVLDDLLSPDVPDHDPDSTTAHREV